MVLRFSHFVVFGASYGEQDKLGDIFKWCVFWREDEIERHALDDVGEDAGGDEDICRNGLLPNFDAGIDVIEPFDEHWANVSHEKRGLFVGRAKGAELFEVFILPQLEQLPERSFGVDIE